MKMKFDRVPRVHWDDRVASREDGHAVQRQTERTLCALYVR